MSEWNKYTTGELFDLINGYAFKSADFKEAGVPIIKIKNVKAGEFVAANFDYVDRDFLRTRADKIVKPNDLLITMSGNRHDGSKETWVGKVAWFNRNETYLVNQRVGILHLKDSEKFNARFLSYQLSSDVFQNHFIAVATSSGGQANLSPSQITNTELFVPDKDTQDKIASILGAFEDKIELNSQINQTLEQIAQAIFKSWFVDFEPVKAKIEAKQNSQDPERAAMCAISGKTDEELDKLSLDQRQQLAATAALFPDELVDSELGEIPGGWEYGALEDLCDLNSNVWTKNNAPEGIWYVDLANTKNGIIESLQYFSWNESPSRARRILIPGDTIIGTVRPGNRSFALIGKTDKQLTASTGFAVLTPKKKEYLEYIYIAATSDLNIERLAHLADGAAYPAVRPDVVTQFAIVIPSISIFQKFHGIVRSIFSCREKHFSQAKILRDIRDTLIPKLLSGQIEVNDKIHKEVA